MKLFYAYLLLLTACHSAFAAPVFTTRTEYYSVSGASARELHHNMQLSGPVQNGKRYDADTNYYVKWTYNTEESGDTCVLSDIKVTVDTVYKLPRWQDYANASQSLQQNWDYYYAKLQAHERGHADHGMNAGFEIEAKLTQLSPMKNCNILIETANKDAYEILGKYQRRDEIYDRETDHGIKQGVILKD